MSSGMGNAPELLIQEAIVVGLHTLVSDRHALSEMVSRDDALRHNTAAEWHDALRDSLRQMLDPQSPKYVDVLLSYPTPAGPNEFARLPAISIIPDGGGENTSEVVAGDLLRQFCERRGPNQEIWRTTEFGAGQRTTLQVGVWTTEQEATVVLYAAVKWALYREKAELNRKGVHELSYTEGGVEPNPKLEPRVAFVPMLNVQMSWTFRGSYREKVPNRVRFLPGKFSA